MRTLQFFTLETPEWGSVKIARVLPVAGDPWGVFAPLKGTPWGNLQVVTGEALSHALHGYAGPLVKTLGAPPEIRLRRIPEGQRLCTQAKGCGLFQKDMCQPGSQLPDCYIPHGVEPVLAAQIALAWRDGFQVVVVEGPEFIL